MRRVSHPQWGLQGPGSHRGRWLLMDMSLSLSACVCALYFEYGMMLVNSVCLYRRLLFGRWCEVTMGWLVGRVGD